MIPSLDAFLIDAIGLRRYVRRLPIPSSDVSAARRRSRAPTLSAWHPGGERWCVSVELPSLNLQTADLSPDHLSRPPSSVTARQRC